MRRAWPVFNAKATKPGFFHGRSRMRSRSGRIESGRKADPFPRKRRSGRNGRRRSQHRGIRVSTMAQKTIGRLTWPGVSTRVLAVRRPPECRVAQLRRSRPRRLPEADFRMPAALPIAVDKSDVASGPPGDPGRRSGPRRALRPTMRLEAKFPFVCQFLEYS